VSPLTSPVAPPDRSPVRAAPVRVLIVDDSESVRRSLAAMLSATDDLVVLGSCANGAAAVALVAAARPDVVLMDIAMPRVDGIAATRRIAALDAAVQVLVLTLFADQRRIAEALAAGAVDYLLKDVASSTLLERIRSLARPETVAGLSG
jgi:DNA-binding NarL/FixJ family response regulator